MLSLWKLRVGAEAYYLGQVARGLDDYYSGDGESKGRWIGTGAGLLGLSDNVTADDLRAVLAGLSPGTGLSPNGTQVRTWKGRVPGFDLTFSAPKSVSVMYAFADPIVRGQIVEAVDSAVDDAMSWLEREACFVRRGSNNRHANTAPFEQWGTRRLPAAGFISAGFRHRTSRAGDPQLHTHVLVANLAKGPDGKWTALDGQALYRSKIAAGAMFQTVLRNELSRRLGVDWRPVRDNVADVAGIPQKVLKHFSKRRTEIADELERTGRSGPAAAADATLATRTPKVEIDQETLDERWLDDAADIDYGPDDINQLLSACTPTPAPEPLAAASTVTARRHSPNGKHHLDVELTVDDFAAHVALLLPDIDARFNRNDVQNAVATALIHRGDAALIERLTDAVLAHRELVPVPQPDIGDAGWEQLWTTRTLLGYEAELTGLFTLPAQDAHALRPDLVDSVLAHLDRPLGPDQAHTVRRLCTQGRPVEVVVGRAGTGKTYTMNTVRDVYHTAGYRLVGVCPTGRAARELADGAGFDSFTVPRFFTEATIGSDTVVIVDEAGMCGTVDLHHVITRAHNAGAKVILVGDHHQLPEVTSGGGFAAALDAIGEQRCELTINRRQHHEWEHTALDHLRHGDLTTFWNTFLYHDRVTLAETAGEIHRRAVDDWWASHINGASAHLIAGTRSEARHLNQLARIRATHAGHLTGPALTVRESEFQTGDRVVLLANMPGQYDLDTGRRCRVDNGMIGTITHLDPNESDVEVELTNGRHIQLTAEYVQGGNIDWGYATTIHKAQGLTCDDIFVVGPNGLYRESAYVALSRARNTARLYATTKDAASIGERTHTTGIPLPSEHLGDPERDIVDTLNHTRARRFALHDTPNLDVIADTATQFNLAQLADRRHHLNTITTALRNDGLVDPTTTLNQLHLAATHRHKMHVGNRVNALDWDNVGTIIHIHDAIGHATIGFETSDGRSTTKVLPWEQTKPIDHPDDAELTDLAHQHLDQRHDQIEVDRAAWNTALRAHGIEPHETTTVATAIDHRQHQLIHRLRATPPDWLTWWAGERPTHPTAAVVYDDHIAALATWRDQQQIPNAVAGFGPAPGDDNLLDQWRTHMDNALATRQWLHQRTPTTSEAPRPIGLQDAHIRLRELDDLFEQAPPDQAKIVDDILASPHIDIAHQLDALELAGTQQAQRRDWILEHWPHIVEHHELNTIIQAAGPLDHWPTALPETAQRLLDELINTSVDTPEERTLIELDRAAAAHNPIHAIRRHENDVKPIRHQIKTFESQPPTDNPTQAIIDQHIARLRERAQDIEAKIRHAEGQATLHRWKRRTDPELADAINRRTNHLAHKALTAGEAWVADIAASEFEANPAVSTNDLRRLIQASAAERERGDVRGPDVPPLDDIGHQSSIAASPRKMAPTSDLSLSP